jgi:tetratricopeptide (TPR) repeat protein
LQLFEQARFPDCVRRLKEAKTAGRDDYELIFTLGSAELENSNFDEAERLLREAIAAGPDRPEARHRLGVVLILAGKPEEARRQEPPPPSSGTLGAVRLDLARAEKRSARRAERGYRKALEVSPDLSWRGTWWFCSAARKAEESAARWRLPGRLRTRVASRQAYNARRGSRPGLVELKAGRYQKALAQFERHPDDPEALRGAAEAYSRLGRRREAVGALERALILKPDDRAIAWRLREEKKKPAK